MISHTPAVLEIGLDSRNDANLHVPGGKGGCCDSFCLSSRVQESIVAVPDAFRGMWDQAQTDLVLSECRGMWDQRQTDLVSSEYDANTRSQRLSTVSAAEVTLDPCWLRGPTP